MIRTTRSRWSSTWTAPGSGEDRSWEASRANMKSLRSHVSQWQIRRLIPILEYDRPPSWNDLGAAESLFHHAMRRAPEPHLAQWSHAAMTGLSTCSASANRDNNLTVVAARVLYENWSRPEHAAALATALEALVP